MVKLQGFFGGEDVNRFDLPAGPVAPTNRDLPQDTGECTRFCRFKPGYPVEAQGRVCLLKNHLPVLLY
jgi:hypothetical protein